MKARQRKLIISAHVRYKNWMLQMLGSIADQLKEKMDDLTEEERKLPLMVDVRVQGESVRKPHADRFKPRDYQRALIDALKSNKLESRGEAYNFNHTLFIPIKSA